MCKCTPSIRTPFCGKHGCTWGEDILEKFENRNKEKQMTFPQQIILQMLISYLADSDINAYSEAEKEFLKVQASALRTYMQSTGSWNEKAEFWGQYVKDSHEQSKHREN